MSRATELADQLHEKYGAWHPDVPESMAVAELRRLDRVNAELVDCLQWVRGHIARYDPPGLPNHVAQKIDAALTSSTGEPK